MRILVVDDESGKREQIVAFLRGSGHDEIDEARSFQSAMAMIYERVYDAIVLDMRLTSFDVTTADDGGRPRKVGGYDVLHKMNRRGLHYPVVVLSQYSLFPAGEGVLSLEQLESSLREEFPFFRGLLQFQHNNLQWQDELEKHLLGRL
jgi:CheY-like chemotaxis protein